jgi:predicted AAA+ superfamily ATPase
MDITTLKRIIIANRRLVERITFVERHITLDGNLNYVFVGLRQAGKSYLMFQQIHRLLVSGHSIDEIVYLNFDDERLIGISSDDLDLILQAHAQLTDCTPILFLDEIQNIEHWEHFARRLANEKYRVYITGSNAKMLSSEIATTLGGRYMIQEVYPYSFREYLEANKIIINNNWEYDVELLNTINRLFDAYFHFGGFPESVNVEQKRAWLSVLYQKIFFGDLVARYHLRSDMALKLLVKKVAESVKQPSSYSRLANVISSAGQKVQTNTIIEYVKYLEETWLLFNISNYAFKFAEKESIKKYYFRDNGILNLFLLDPNTSLLENLVAIELKKRHGDDVFFYNKSVEVDFYLPNEATAIQVCYSLIKDETRKREITALEKVGHFLNTQKYIVITYSEEDKIETNNIQIEVIPVWKWLLKNK